jgi:hypothetical protein
MEERRVAHRYKLPLPVTVKRLPLDPPAGEMHVTTRDVSTSGVYFTSGERLAVGIKLDLSLVLPTEITQGSAVVIDAQARVMRVDEQPTSREDRFGIAAIIDKFNISRAAVDFALHKAEQVTVNRRPSAAASG